MTETKIMTTCDQHGILNEKVSNIEKTVSKLEDGQIRILEKMDAVLAIRTEDTRQCEKHRVKLMEEVEETIAPLKSAIKLNTDFRKHSMWYILAVLSVSAVFYKFLI